MYKKDQSIKLLLQQKLLPPYYHNDPEISKSILQALYEAGIRMAEYTARGENALTNFKELRKFVDVQMNDMQLGIGTIKNVRQARSFINEGADFIVSPIINEEVGSVTHDSGLLWIPGCMSPTEIARAEESGATIIKIFPGNILGPSYIQSIKELFPGLRFMPTGGVEAEKKNLKEWFASGVVAVGMGSKLISKELVEDKDFKAIRNATEHVLRIIKEITSTHK